MFHKNSLVVNSITTARLGTTRTELDYNQERQSKHGTYNEFTTRS